MMLPGPLAALRDFLETGGVVLVAIFVVAVCLWTLLLERCWYLRVGTPAVLERLAQIWHQREDRTSWYARCIRVALLAEAGHQFRRFLLLARTLVALCPLLGILGTVTGMIQVFDVMAFHGTGNARGMAEGISRATLPTMAGLVVAISGLSFISWLEKQAELRTHQLADRMRHY
ncbi:MAG: MotA/TolQ/ExbB proton channel family protein [Puniceicoccaceae bacterium]|nr:MAG: MotA/TolQ/ExbB proton channel family protein [Puniceicoccaceae bacterium]